MPSSTPLFLCADCGGTKARVCITDPSGPLAVGLGGSCNLYTVGPTRAIAAILDATHDALSRMPGAPDTIPQFASIWIAMAGVQTSDDAKAFLPYLRSSFNLPSDYSNARVTNDCDLLAAPLLTHSNSSTCVTIVAGTGSCGLSFRKTAAPLSTTLSSSEFALERVGVCRGWGYLLGDEGSAYHLGMLAIRSLLQLDDDRNSSSSQQPQSRPTQFDVPPSPASSSPSNTTPFSPTASSFIPLHQDLLETFGVAEPSQLIGKAYSAHGDTYEASESARKLWIASGARIVLDHAFGKQPPIKDNPLGYTPAAPASPILSSSSSSDKKQNGNVPPISVPTVGSNAPTMSSSLLPAPTPSQVAARHIAFQAVDALVDMIVRLVGDSSTVDPQNSLLLLGGGLWQVAPFKNAVIDRLEKRNIRFSTTQVIPDAATAGATALAESYRPHSALSLS